MPTNKDRIQVLLFPADYAAVKLMADEEQRSLGAMGAVLIREAIAARKKAGTFVPDVDSSEEAMKIAKLRKLARQLGKGTNELLVQEKAREQSERDELLDLVRTILNP